MKQPSYLAKQVIERLNYVSLTIDSPGLATELSDLASEGDRRELIVLAQKLRHIAYNSHWTVSSEEIDPAMLGEFEQCLRIVKLGRAGEKPVAAKE
jgi:hypothetical protein